MGQAPGNGNEKVLIQIRGQAIDWCICYVSRKVKTIGVTSKHSTFDAGAQIASEKGHP